MGPDLNDGLVLWFNKINAPDPGKKAPVIIDVNVMREERGQLGTVVLSLGWRQL